MRFAVPSYGTYLKVTPAALPASAIEYWLVDPSDAPTTIWSGRFLASSTNSLNVFQGVFAPTVITEGVEETMQTGSNAASYLISVIAAK